MLKTVVVGTALTVLLSAAAPALAFDRAHSGYGKRYHAPRTFRPDVFRGYQGEVGRYDPHRGYDRFIAHGRHHHKHHF